MSPFFALGGLSWAVGSNRTMALDFGGKKIGVAITDQLGLTAQCRPTLIRSNDQEDILKIQQLAEENDVAEVVVGHPLHMDGTASRQSKKTEGFARKLRTVLSVPVKLWDERLTSFAAEQHLEQLGLDWRARRKHVDEMAAVLILEDYLGGSL